MIINLQNNKGFSLLEMLLTTAIVTGLLLVVFNLFEEYAENVLAKATAKYMDNISLAVTEILNDTDYFSQIYILADSEPNDILELSFNDLLNGFDTIPASNRLNSSIRQETPLKTGVEIMVRIADDPSINTDVAALEVIIVTDEPVLITRVRRIATILKSYGGFYIDDGGNIESAFAAWGIASNLFDTTSWGGIIATTPPSMDNGAYIVHYRHLSFDDVSGDYVYRDNIIGRPELNQMYTDLNMGGNNILGADNINISGNLNIEGGAIINGAMNIGGDANFSKANLVANNKLSATNANILGNGSGVRGNFSIDSDLQVGSMAISGLVSADVATFNNGLITSGDMRVDQVDFAQGFTANEINTTSLNGDGSYNINVGEQLNAAEINLQTLAVINGDIGTIDTKLSGNLNISDDIDSPSVGFGVLNVGTFGACDQGC